MAEPESIKTCVPVLPIPFSLMSGARTDRKASRSISKSSQGASGVCGLVHESLALWFGDDMRPTRASVCVRRMMHNPRSSPDSIPKKKGTCKLRSLAILSSSHPSNFSLAPSPSYRDRLDLGTVGTPEQTGPPGGDKTSLLTGTGVTGDGLNNENETEGEGLVGKMS